jgi:hypothetical protein
MSGGTLGSTSEALKELMEADGFGLAAHEI